MKNLKRTSVFILSLLMFTFSSCNDEPLEGQFDTGGGNGGGGNATTCVDATNNVADATTAFSAVTPADANYTAVCNDYLNALQDFLDLCGDSTGAVQALIDGLDCTSDMPDDCPSAQAATNSAETAYNGDPSNAVLCNAYISALENEIAVCGDTDGSLQDIIDGLSCTETNDYWPRAIGNVWNYNTSEGTEETYVISGTEMIDGSEFYVFDDLFGVPSWLRKESNNYFLRAQFSGEIMGISFSSTPYIVNMIKDDAIVGETWQSEVSYTISYEPSSGIPDADVEAVYAFEMIERDLTRTVEGENYEDVIHIELVVTSGTQTLVVQYFYANQIGLIEYITELGANTLRSYSLN